MSRPNESSFLEAFDAYADALFRHAALRLSDRERARDLTQDAFIKAWDYLSTGGEVRKWKSFLYRVLNNLIVDEYRRSKSLSLDALFDEERGGAETFAAPEDRRDLEEAIDTARSVAHIRALIKKLPEPHRGALVLRYVDGLTPKEIARTLGISENAAAVRVHRAIERLKILCRIHRLLP